MRLLLSSALILAVALAFAPVNASAVVLNEIRIDQGGADASEYVELAGTPGESLTGVFLIVIGDATGAGAGGGVEEILDLTGNQIAADGLFLIAEDTFGTGGLGLTGEVDLVADINLENSDNVTYLLVESANDSLHVGTGFGGSDVDQDDDGQIDATGDWGGDGGDDGAPWDAVIDCVALIETPGLEDLTYCETTVGPDGTFVPAHVYLCDGGEWLIGPFGGGDDTPSDPNSCPVPTESTTWGQIKSKF